MDTDSRIRVVARIRPKIRKEIGERGTVTRLDDYCTLRVAGSTDDDLEEVRTSIFRFDSVYNEDDDQVTVYEEEVADIVDHCLSGQPATVLAYGQTGSGKTHSILGKTAPDGGLHAESGIFLRVFCDLFRVGLKNVKLAAVELYCDDVFDLLDGRVKRKLRDAGTETFIADMKEVSVSSLEDVLQVFDVANKARSVSATSMNDQSSRSHAVFFITIPPRPNITPNPTKMMLVDLAGSERIKKSQAVGGAVAEAAAINASLSTLGTVVHAMYSGSNHIPYRDSKLTGVLKSTFSNKLCRVLLIGQFSPAASNSLESIGTAKFCDRVKGLAANGPLDGGASAGGADGEEAKATLKTLQQHAEVSTELRIARTLMNFKRKQLRPENIPPALVDQQLLSDPSKMSSLKQEVQNEIQQKEENESREAVLRCERMKQKLFQTFVAKRDTLQQDYNSLESKLTAVQNTLQQNKSQLEAEVEEKMKEAKRAKKRRVVNEEKFAELRSRVEVVNAELAKTPENYVLPPSLVDFDGDDDPTLGEDEKKAEASHAIVADFYRHWQTVVRQYGEAVQNEEKTQKWEQELKDIRSGGLSLWIQQFASDIVAFSWRRACDIGENLIESNEPWAWPDVMGSSRILVDSANWVPNPLPLVPLFPKQPVDDEDRILATKLDFDDIHGRYKKAAGVDEEHHNNNEDDNKNNLNATTGSSNTASSITPVITTPIDEKKDKDQQQQQKPLLPQTASTTSASSLAGLPPIAGKGMIPQQQTAATAPSATSSSAANSAITTATSKAAAAAEEAKKKEAAATAEDENQKENNNKDNNSGTKAKTTTTKRKKTPEEIAQAEKHYLMGIYDSKNLVNDLIKFLENGTKVMKYGRAGDPHLRHAWIKDHYIFWTDPDPKADNKTRHNIPVSGIRSIVLGPHSKVFKRFPMTADDPRYFLSFTIHLKDNSRTLDFIAENLVDFEAWVIGLVNLGKVDAVWGKNLACDQLETSEYNQLTSFEKALCDTENIRPSTFQKVHAKVIEIRNDVAMHMRAFRGNSEQAFQTMGGGIHMPAVSDSGAILMTKGELRYYCSAFNVDIFRVCKLFEYFRDMGIIFDPAYTPINKFGITTKS